MNKSIAHTIFYYLLLPFLITLGLILLIGFIVKINTRPPQNQGSSLEYTVMVRDKIAILHMMAIKLEEKIGELDSQGVIDQEFLPSTIQEKWEKSGRSGSIAFNRVVEIAIGQVLLMSELLKNDVTSESSPTFGHIARTKTTVQVNTARRTTYDQLQAMMAKYEQQPEYLPWYQIPKFYDTLEPVTLTPLEGK
jgi:hypothetical protein